MTSKHIFVTTTCTLLLGFVSVSWSEDSQMVGDAETLPLEQDPSTIESQDQALDTSQTQEEPNEPIPTPDSFEPTETISEDIAVPFPVDI
ncbi:MAG: hypothetical protein MK316_10340 [Pseudomonadales bacterium]|nr:hypothetical protein [Pseudomonadales bacterium]